MEGKPVTKKEKEAEAMRQAKLAALRELGVYCRKVNNGFKHTQTKQLFIITNISGFLFIVNAEKIAL